MVRVIYRWRVSSENFDAFRRAWRNTTQTIHQNVEGAKGSLLLRSEDDVTQVLTMATWDSTEHWQRFWGESNPQQMEKMRSLGTRISVEVFEQVEDQTL